jgi:hypothetical protein
MKPSLKAALLSGLLLPGVGQLSLKRRRRGWALSSASLGASAVMGWSATQRALVVVDRITSGETALDSASIEQLLDASSSASRDVVSTLCLLVLAGCWLFGIADSFRTESKLP